MSLTCLVLLQGPTPPVTEFLFVMVFAVVIVFLRRWRVYAFVHVVVAEERPVGRLGVRGASGGVF